MGLKDIKIFNLALLGKWKWNLFHHQGELWARVLESKYEGWRNLDVEGTTSHESIWWKDLKSVVSHSHQGRILQSGLKWKVGCGDRIKFWEDTWINDEETLAASFPRLYLISCQQNQLLQQMGNHKETEWEWNFSWRRPLFDNEIDSAVNFLTAVEGQRIQQMGTDVWEWKGDPSGLYSTQSAYNLLRAESAEGSQVECFKELWKLKIPPKVAVFAWRLLWDRLPTRKNLQR